MEKLIIFAKAPRAGEVKTRLAETLGAEAALEAYREMVRTLFTNLAELKHVEVAFTPADGEGELREFAPARWKFRAQREGGLEARLVHAFEEALQGGEERVVVIGSDCPAVMPEHIRQAFRALRKVEAVFGPSTDGGYWLVGLRSPQPELFQGIPWSTPEVLAGTLAAAKRLGLKIDLLEILADIDTAEDWKEFKKQKPA